MTTADVCAIAQVGLGVIPVGQSLVNVATRISNRACFDQWVPVVHEVVRAVDPNLLDEASLEEFETVTRTYRTAKLEFTKSLGKKEHDGLKNLWGFARKWRKRRRFVDAAARVQRKGLSLSTDAYLERNSKHLRNIVQQRTGSAGSNEGHSSVNSGITVNTSPSGSTSDKLSPNYLTPSFTYPPPIYSPGAGGGQSGPRGLECQPEQSMLGRPLGHRVLYPISEVPADIPW